MDTTRTPLPGIPAGLFFGMINPSYKLIPLCAIKAACIISNWYTFTEMTRYRSY